MRGSRGLLAAVSGHLAGRHYLPARTLQTLAQREPVRLRKLSPPDTGILELTLERPEVKNAISWELMTRLRAAVDKIDADAEAKVVLVASSVPGVFCAGADLKERRLMSSSQVKEYANSLRSTFSYFEALSIPTIAVIEGAALGGGLELALSCDLRICGENATLGLPETGLAIIPGAGGTQRLPRIIGRSRAKELIFTGRRCDATEAVMMGLANYCVPAGEAYGKALEVAREIAKKGPLGGKNGQGGRRPRDVGGRHALRVGCGRGVLREAAAHAGSPRGPGCVRPEEGACVHRRVVSFGVDVDIDVHRRKVLTCHAMIAFWTPATP